MIRYLTQDIVSHTNRSNIYGVYGEKVSLITDGVGAKIVEDTKGKRFSVKDEYLSLTPIVTAVDPIKCSPVKEIVKSEKTVRKESKKPLTQLEKLQAEYLKSKS